MKEATTSYKNGRVWGDSGLVEGLDRLVTQSVVFQQVVVGQSTVDYRFTNRPETSAPRGALI